MDNYNNYDNYDYDFIYGGNNNDGKDRENKDSKAYKAYRDYGPIRDAQKTYFTRANIRIISFAVAFMLVGAGFFMSGLNEKKRLERETSAVYSRAFSELANYVCAINASLEKILYVTNPEQMTAVSSEIFRQVGFAKADLGQLPVYSSDLNNMRVFLAQTGDYVYTIAQRAVRDNSVNLQTAEKDNINMLLTYSNKLAEQLVSMQDGINMANRSGAVLDIIRTGLDNKNLPEFSNISNITNTSDISNISDILDTSGVSDISTLNDIERIFADYPRLIYDGPFSYSALSAAADKAYKMLAGEKELSTAEARAKAAGFLGVPETMLKSRGATNSKNPTAGTHNFDYGSKFIRVSEKGGYVLNYITDRPVTDQLMSDEDALNAAKTFLADAVLHMGAGSDTILKETYYITVGGMMTINFAAVQDGIILYLDLIKVGVALDNCEILLYEASGYLQNHTARDLSGITVAITMDEAAEAVSPLLMINSVNLAVIPAEYDKENEVLCYEFKCANPSGREYIVYVNAKTGLQQDMLVIIDTGRGKLVI